MTERVGDLEIGQDLKYQKRQWTVQRAGWAIMCLLLLAAAGASAAGKPWGGEAVVRAAVVYLFLLLIFRVAGKRSLAQITTFDFVILLIISEAVQPALTGEGPPM